MIASLTADLAARLVVVKVPCTVVFGRERFERGIPSEPFVQVLYTDGAGVDSFDPPGTTRDFTSSAYWKWVSLTINVIGRSSAAGADETAHKRAVEGLADRVLIALRAVTHKRRNQLRNIRGGFLPPEPSEPGIDRPSREVGARYQFVLQVGRAVLEETDAASAEDLVVVNTTQIKIGAQDAPETSCGGD